MEKTLKESMEWENPNKGTITVVAIKPIMVDGKEKGSKEEVFKMETNYDDLLHGKTVLMESIAKLEQKISEKTSQLEALGKVPKKTAEMVRVMKMFEQLQKIDQANNLTKELQPLHEQLLEKQHNLKVREELLSQRPTA